MNGKDAIIANIITSAETAAAGIISDAQAEKDTDLERLHNDLSAKLAEQIEIAKAQSEELIKRRGTLSSLDERKILLSAKQKIIDSVYYQVISKILNMTDNIYRDFIAGIINKFAEDGDVISVSERDSKRLHADWASALSTKLKLRLSMSGEFNKSRGGVVLIGKKYDKNLTLDTMAEALRATTEGEAAKRLFNNL